MSVDLSCVSLCEHTKLKKGNHHNPGMKRAQTTLFLIIAVILVLGAAMVFFLFSQGYVGELNPFFFSKNSIQSFVTDAVDMVVDDGLHKLGVQGGYLDIPAGILFNCSSPTSRLRSLNGTDIPTKEHIERELEGYVRENVKDALDDFRPFEERGMEVETGTPRVDVIILEQGVIVTLNMPVTVVKGENTIRVSEFKYNKNKVRIPMILSAIHNITEFTEENPHSVDMTILDSLDFDFTIVPYNATHFVYLITDHQSTVDNEPYRFRFALDTRE